MSLANRPHFRPWLAGVLFERPPPPRAERRQWRGDFTASDLKNDATAALGRRQQGLDVDLELHALQKKNKKKGFIEYTSTRHRVPAHTRDSQD